MIRKHVLNFVIIIAIINIFTSCAPRVKFKIDITSKITELPFETLFPQDSIVKYHYVSNRYSGDKIIESFNRTMISKYYGSSDSMNIYYSYMSDEPGFHSYYCLYKDGVGLLKNNKSGVTLNYKYPCVEGEVYGTGDNARKVLKTNHDITINNIIYTTIVYSTKLNDNKTGYINDWYITPNIGVVRIDTYWLNGDNTVSSLQVQELVKVEFN